MNRRTLATSFLNAVCLFALLFALNSQALASGSKAGNGGHGVMCEGAVFVELLDLYEAREIYDIPKLFSAFNTTESEIERLRFEMSLILPAGHGFLAVFDQARKLFESRRLVDSLSEITTDVGITAPVLPTHCELVQLAKRSWVYDQFTTVAIVRSYWERMTTTEQALLLIHEASHEWFATLAEDSEFPSTLAVRQIVGILSSTTDYRIEKKVVINRIVDSRVPAFNHEL